jgi:tetratricopeptide (TPR) repeat protein
MLATQATNLSKWDEKLKASAEEEYESFRNVLDWTDGFGLAFVQCSSPVQGSELVEKIKRDLRNKQVDILQFQEGEEIRNLYDLVEQLPNREQIDILFIQGLEYSFVPYIKSGYGGQGDYYKLDNLPPILGHLNLQRERFRRDFEICFVFLLPFFGIKYFIQRAPDFFDWRSGLFKIVTEKDLLKRHTFRIIEGGSIDQYYLCSSNERMTKILEIETLLKEDLEPEDKSLLLLKQGNLLVASSAYEEAISSFDNALKIKPDDQDAWFIRGIALSSLGKNEEAISSYNNALKFKPDKDEAWNNRGSALGNLGRNEEAIASFDNALKFKPDLHKAWNNRGSALFNLRRFEEAISSFDNALKFKPDYPEAWYNRGTALFNLRRFEEAISSFDNALKFKPDYPDAWDNRGYALFNLGRFEEAIASFDNALKIKPDDATSYYNKACIYALQENIDLAIENFKQAINLDSVYLEMAKTDPDFDKIRNDSRFINLLNIEH